MLVKRKIAGMVSSNDAKEVAESFLKNLQVQSLGQHDRKVGLRSTMETKPSMLKCFHLFYSHFFLSFPFSLNIILL